MKKYIANSITCCRIICSILILFFPVFSTQFYILYLLCGLSDMVDGTVAKITNSISEFGAQLDTLADTIFVVVSLIKFLPFIYISNWLWVWIVVIAIIKISNIMWGLAHNKKLVALHTIMNKITGMVLFLLPLMLAFVEIKYSVVVVCLLATISAIQERYYIVIGYEVV